MKLPMNPLGAAAIAAANGVGMYALLVFAFCGDKTGSAISGAVVGMLTFGILIMESDSSEL